MKSFLTFSFLFLGVSCVVKEELLPPSLVEIVTKDIDTLLVENLPRGAAWNNAKVDIKSNAFFKVECKFGSEARFSTAAFTSLSKTSSGFSLTLTKPSSSPDQGLYKIQCRSSQGGIVRTSKVYEIFFHNKLASDFRCDNLSNARPDSFYFDEAKKHLNISGKFGAGSDLTKSMLRIEFSLPLVWRLTQGHASDNGDGTWSWAMYLDDNGDAVVTPAYHFPFPNNAREGASVDKFAGNPGVGFIKEENNYVFSHKATLRKLVRFDKNNEFLIIRKALSFKGSCSFWIRTTQGREDGANGWEVINKKNGQGAFDIHSVVINSRGEAIYLKENGDVAGRAYSIYSRLRGSLIKSDFYESSDDPAISHKWYECEDDGSMIGYNYNCEE